MVNLKLKDDLTPKEFELYTKLLITTIWKGGYPHEIMVCMFNKCFEVRVEVEDEEKDPRKIEKRKIWAPRRIAEELSDISLRELCQKLKEDYVAASSLPEELVNDCFGLLNTKMSMRVSEIINPFDRNARKRLTKILDKLAGETTLRDYYGVSPEDNIADWSYRVLKKVKKFLAENNWLERSLGELLKEDP